jgi:hypothetical protein
LPGSSPGRSRRTLLSDKKRCIEQVRIVKKDSKQRRTGHPNPSFDHAATLPFFDAGNADNEALGLEEHLDHGF